MCRPTQRASRITPSVNGQNVTIIACLPNARNAGGGNAVDSGAGGFRRPLELIPFYRHGYLELPGIRCRGLRTAQDFAQAVKVNRGLVSRKRDDVFDPRPNIDGGR